MSVEPLVKQFEMTTYVMKANVGDVTHEESLVSPKPAGNCLNWVLGHLVVIRNDMLRQLGGKPAWTEAESKSYDRHGPPLSDPANAKPLDEIWGALDETLGAIKDVTSKLTPDQFTAKVPFPTDNPDETIGSLITTIAFHDAYHAGQTGLLRRVIGKPPRDL